MSIDWNWGIFLQQAPFGNTTYLGWLWSGFQVTVALSISAWIGSLSSSALYSTFTHRSKSLPFGHRARCTWSCFVTFRSSMQFFTWYLVIPELPAGKIGHMVLNRSSTEHSVLRLLHAVPGAVYRRSRLRAGTRRYSVSASRAEERRLAMGLTLPQTYRYVLLPNAYRVIVPPMTSEMMNLVKNSAIASTIGLVDMAAQAGKLLDYSAHAWESFTAITLAYVLINAVIMLVMNVVERKIRLPGDLGGK